MATHDNDLRRRYREIDFVSEFQKYWAYFNKWFKTETKKPDDRKSIEALKKNKRVRKIIADLLTESQKHIPLFNSPARDLVAYLAENKISIFVRECWLCSIIRKQLNLFNPEYVNMVRGTTTVHITIQEFRHLYSLCRKMEARLEFMSEPEVFMSRLFEIGQIRHVGSCFYGEPQVASAMQSRLYDAIWNSIENDALLATLSDLKISTHKPGICSDVLEMLYLVRNNTVHGTLDFVDKTHNAASRSGAFLLQAIIEKLV